MSVDQAASMPVVVASSAVQAEPSAGTPSLSLILVAASGWESITRTLDHLEAQTVCDRLELIVVCEQPAPEQTTAHPFHSVRVVPSGAITERGKAAALGIDAATAPLVGLVEDHAFPDSSWAECLIDAHRGHCDGAGSLVRNANPAAAMSWVNYLITYGPLRPGTAHGERTQIPWHNSTYKREALLQRRDRLPELLAWEERLQNELRADGARLVVATGAFTDHMNVSRFASSLQLGLHRGRIMGANRARRENWSLSRRALHACAFPVYPLFLLRQLLPQIWSQPLSDAMRLRTTLALLPVAAAMALGEIMGVLRGVGPAMAALEDFEMHRLAHIHPAEREMMYTRRSDSLASRHGTAVAAGQQA